MPADLARRFANEGLLTDDELAFVVARRAVSGEPVPVVLRTLGYADETGITAFFERLGFAPIVRIKPSAMLSALPKGMARTLWVLPVGETPAGVVVAMADPTDPHALSELQFHLRRPIDPRPAALDALRAVLLEHDPPEVRPQGRTAPAPGLPADAASAEATTVVLPVDPPRLPRSSRRSTPAYGQQSPHMGAGRVPSWGTINALGDHGDQLRRLAGGALTIGSYRAPSEPPPVAPRPRSSEHALPATKTKTRRASKAHPLAIPRDALHTLAELRNASDRDAIARIVARGMTGVAQRAAFFVVKRGVVQGWEGATVDGSGAAGLHREALRNLWIPITSPSVFRTANDLRGIYVGPPSESTADSILCAALGGRVKEVLVAPVQVRGHVIAFIYADGLQDAAEARARAEDIVAGSAEALERSIVAGRGR